MFSRSKSHESRNVEPWARRNFINTYTGVTLNCYKVIDYAVKRMICFTYSNVAIIQKISCLPDS